MKKKRTWKKLSMLLLMAILVLTMSLSAEAAAKLSKSKASLYPGNSITLNVSGTKSKVKWSSSNKKVAKVSSKGKVTAVKQGSTTIKAKVGKKTYKCKITVKAPALSQKKLSLTVNTSQTLKLNGTKIKSVSTSNKKIATVTKKGKVTAKKVGKCTITVKGANKKTYKCQVTVTAAKPKATATPVPATATPVPKQLATGITVSQANVSLKLNETAQLTAVVTPDNTANKNVTWSSSDPSVASVDANGLVTAKAAGTTTIKVATVDGSQKTATCTVTVILNQAIVSSQAQLDKVMQESGSELEQLTIQSSGNEYFTIPEGTKTSAELVVDVPNGEVVNNALFKQIVIQAIAKNTYIEKAAGNTIIYKASSGRITVDAGASTNISICKNDSVTPELELVKNGTVSELKLETTANVSISGISDASSLAVTSTSAAGGSKISTSLNLNLTAESKVSLQLNAGAENTTAKVSDESFVPEVTGLGKVPVTDNSGAVLDTIMAENTESVETQDVTVTGKIVDSANSAKANVDVYFIKYVNGIDSGNIKNYLTSENKAATTDENGSYSFKTVWGNYYLAAVSEGYVTELQTVEITSASGSSFSNETIRLTEGKNQGTGDIELQLNDALTGENVNYPLILKVRSGSNNITGSALRTVSLAADDNGHYTVSDLTAGSYTIQAITDAASDTKITSASFNVTVVSGLTEKKSFTITRVIEDQQIRFVLTWGTKASGAPSDLDSHLVGPSVSGNTRFHTWYSNKEYYDNDTKYADLDVDDTSWEGPETTTIYSAVSGTYSFYIYDFSDQDDEDSRNMSDKSSAVVNVYRGSQLLNTFYVPTGCSGNLWHVCDYDSNTGKVTSVNSIGYWPEGGSSTVGLTTLEVLKSTLNNNISSLSDVVDYLADNNYKKDTQTLLSQAKSLYSDSEDEDALKEMVTKLEERISVISRLQITVSYQGDSYGGDFYNGKIDIRGLEDTLGNIEVTAVDSSEDFNLSVEDVTGQDYVKLITLTDASTGAARIWKVYYTYDVSIAFRIQGVTGDGVTDYYVDQYYDDDDNSVITVRKDRSTVSNLKLTVMDGVTYEIGNSDNNNFDAVVNMKYGDSSYKYYVRYVNDSNLFGISDIYGEEIVRYSSDYDDENGKEIFHIYGTTAILPEINISTLRDNATAEVIDNSIIRVKYNDIYMDYSISYTYLTELDIAKESLNSKMESLEEQIRYLSDNDYKTATQNLLKEAKALYSDSEDKDAVNDMINKLDKRMSDIDNLWFHVSYQETSYYCGTYSDYVYISGLEDTLGDIKVTTSGSSDNFKVDITDVTGQDYVKLITLTDTSTGAARTCKVYYKYDITAAFNIMNVTGDGVTNYNIDRSYDDDEYSVITVYKNKSTVSNLQLSVIDGVTYTVETSGIEGYDALVNMSYRGNTYQYYLRYINDPDCFYIYIYGDGITNCDHNYDDNTFYITGTAETLPDLNITANYDGATAELTNNNTIRVSCNDIYHDYNVVYRQLTALEVSKDSLNRQISSLEYRVDYLYDNDYKAVTQSLLKEAKALYSNSEDEDAVNDMISKLTERISVTDRLWIDAIYEGNYYFGSYYSDSISISDLKDTLDDIEVKTDSSSDNLNVDIKDITDQDYVKLITLTDTTTGAAKTWKVYYKYNVLNAFKILSIVGDGITGSSYPSTPTNDGTPEITIYKNQSTVSNLTFTVMDGVAYTIVASDNTNYDAMVTMTYGDYTYKYYIRYEYNSSCFEISGITGDGIIKTSCDYSDDRLDVYGTSATQPELGKITTYYSEATAEIIDSSTIRVTYDGVSKDYKVSYTQITPVELTLNTDYEFTLSSYRGSYASFTPDASGYYILSSASEGSNLYSYVYCDGGWYEYYNLSSKVYLNAGTTYYFELHASNSDTATAVTLCMTKDSDTDSTADASAADAGISDEIFGDGTSDSTVESAETVETQDAESFTVEEDVDPAENETSVEIADDETEDAAASDESSEVSIEDFSE